MDLNMDINKVAKINTSGTRTMEQMNEKLDQVCKDFESIFLNQMFKVMRGTQDSQGIFGDSNAKKIYDSMYYDELSRDLAKTDALGIGKAVYKEMKKQMMP